MKTTDIITSAIALAQEHTPQLAEQLTQLQNSLQQSTLKVVVLGDFKAGKSTLLNRLFLKTNLLPTEYLEATAVPTCLSEGELCMQIWQRNDDGTETMVNTRASFTDAELADAVTASTPEVRAEMAEKYSRVVVQKPGILPPGIILVDTPGLNSTNQRIVVGTLNEAKNADAVLYVVRGRQLSQLEVDRISRLAGSQQVKVPVHVVLTIESSMIEQGQVDNLRQTIAAQLSENDIECGVSVFDLENRGEDSTTPLSNDINTSWDEEWLQPTAATNSSDGVHTASDSEIESELLSFFNGRVNQGRGARLRRELLPLLGSLKLAIESRLSLSSQSAENLKLIEEQLREKEKEYSRVVQNLLTDTRLVQTRYMNGLEKHLDDYRIVLLEGIKSKEDVAEVIECLKDWNNKLPTRLQRACEIAQMDLQQDINDIADKYKVEMGNVMTFDNSLVNNIDLGRFVNVASKIPSLAVYLADYLIFGLICPTGPFTDMILRYVAGRVPGIKTLMPGTLGKGVVIQVASKNLTETMDEIKSKLRAKSDEAFEQMRRTLSKELSGNMVYAEINNAMDEARKGMLTAEQTEALKKAEAQVQEWGNIL